MGCDCRSQTAPFAADPCRRVNYTLGMILGVDDFVQESVYHSSHREALARLALGYGTASGLDVRLVPIESEGASDLEVRVSPGAAILPSGRLVHVGAEQCCSLLDWAGTPRIATTSLTNPDGSRRTLPEAEKQELRPGGGLWVKAWVSLSFAESKCAEIPLPGDPCRTDDKLTAPSRIEDGFHLDLSWIRPDQREEDALRAYFRWICSIPLDKDKSELAERELLDAIREKAKLGLPTTGEVPEDYMPGSPAPQLRYKGELLRSVMRLWITEIRPLWFACCADSTLRADTVMLSGIWIPVVEAVDGLAIDKSRVIELEQTKRPTLLSLRALQEMVRQLEDQFYDMLPEPSDSVVAGKGFGLAPEIGTSERFARADHTHGTPAFPDLEGDLEGSLENGKTSVSATVVRLRGRNVSDQAPASDQVLTFKGDRWSPEDLPAPAPLAGDVEGAPGENRLRAIQGIELSGTPPVNGQVLQYDGEIWKPSNTVSVVPVAGDLAGTTFEARVEKLRGTPVSGSPPTNGQILSFESGEWRPKDPTAAPVSVGGDLAGPLASAKVQGIAGVSVSANAPAYGQVLTFNGAQWFPADPPSSGPGDLGGDVEGPGKENTLARIQGRPVKAAEPQEGQILRFRDGVWVPDSPGAEVGEAVSRMGTPYGLIAAGEVVVRFGPEGKPEGMEPRFLYHCNVDNFFPEDADFRMIVVPEYRAEKIEHVVQLAQVWTKQSPPCRLLVERNGATDFVRVHLDRFREQDLSGEVAFQFQVFQTPLSRR